MSAELPAGEPVLLTLADRADGRGRRDVLVEPMDRELIDLGALVERVVERDDTLDVQRHQTITVKNNRTETVKEGNESVTVSQGNRSVTVSQGNDSLDVSAGDHSRNVGKNISEEAGMGIKIKAGTSITIEAGISIELKVGGNKITIDNAGITVKGIMVTADGSASTGGGAALVAAAVGGAIAVGGANLPLNAGLLVAAACGIGAGLLVDEGVE